MYYWLCQLRVVSRSLTYQSRLPLVHAFVTSHDSCCCLLAGLPLGTRLDRVLRSTARLVGGGGCPNFLPSLPTCVMYYIGSLFLSRYRIVSLQWSPVVSFTLPPLFSCGSISMKR